MGGQCPHGLVVEDKCWNLCKNTNSNSGHRVLGTDPGTVLRTLPAESEVLMWRCRRWVGHCHTRRSVAPIVADGAHIARWKEAGPDWLQRHCLTGHEGLSAKSHHASTLGMCCLFREEKTLHTAAMTVKARRVEPGRPRRMAPL